MKLSVDPRLPQAGDLQDLKQRLSLLFRDIAIQVNQVSEGQLQGTYNAGTAAPSAGTYRQGDFIRNSQPTEQGTAGSKYLVAGWMCVAGGAPGTWVQCRYLTGN